MKKIVFDETPKELEEVYDCNDTPIKVGDIALFALSSNALVKVVVVKICKKTITVRHNEDVIPNGIKNSWKGYEYYEDYYNREWQKNVMPTALYILNEK